jgi:hypothetical protein
MTAAPPGRRCWLRTPPVSATADPAGQLWAAKTKPGSSAQPGRLGSGVTFLTSTDDGRSWQRLPTWSLPEAIALSVVSQDVAYAITQGAVVSRIAMSGSTGILKSRMAARTWLRASAAAAGSLVSRTRRWYSSVGRVGVITSRSSANLLLPCVENAAASCSARHRSADGYSTAARLPGSVPCPGWPLGGDSGPAAWSVSIGPARGWHSRGRSWGSR